MFKNIQRFSLNNQGHTLIELIVTLGIMAMVLTLCFGTIGFFNTMISKIDTTHPSESDLRFLHVFLQKQIESSDTLYLSGGELYVRDMETPTYFNHYKINSTSGLLYRYKSKEINGVLKDIGAGEKSQLTSSLSAFSLQPSLTNGQPDGNILLDVQFENDPNQTYEIIIYYPGNPENIKIQ